MRETTNSLSSCHQIGGPATRRQPPGLQARLSIPLFSGASLGLAYSIFGVLAWIHYPTQYSPFHNNTLSQLGNSNLNPHGAPYYLIGCALSGILAMAFFLSLHPWRSSGTRVQNRVLLLVQALGVIGGFGLVMNAVYPENHLPMHHFWAGVVFNSLGAAMLLAPFALWRRGHPNLRLAGISVLASLAVLMMFVFAGTHWMEWVPVTVFLIAPALLGFHTVTVAGSAGTRTPLHKTGSSVA